MNMIISEQRMRGSVLGAVKMSCMFAVLLTSGCALVPGMYAGSDPVHGAPIDLDIDNRAVRFYDINDSTAIASTTPLQQVATRTPQSSPRDQESDYEYRVGKNDVLRIVVWDHPELNNPGIGPGSPAATPANITAASSGASDPIGRTVQADGTIYFPYIGIVAVAGETLPEIRLELTRLLSKYITQPQLDVSVSSFRSKTVYISGEVKQPGIVSLTDKPIRIADLIQYSGGYLPDADLGGATLSRNGNDIHIDLYAMFYGGDYSQNILLKNGDHFNVPESRFNKIFVLGEVVKPGSVLLPRGQYSLTEALSDAGGASQLTSNSSQIYVVRMMAGGDVNVYHLDGKNPIALVLGDSFALRPRDVVYVDPAGVTRIYRVLSQLLPFATGASNAATVVK